jgi:hypothetical protein
MPSLPKSRLIAFVLIAVLGCAVDLWTKSWIFGKLGMPVQAPPIVLWPQLFSLTTSLN